jgi:hypothetical protein
MYAPTFDETKGCPMVKKGDFVQINKQVGVVVMIGQEMGGDLENHTGIWFGTYENGAPEVWTIPTEYLAEGPAPVLQH